MLSPGLARTQPNSRTAQCLSNKRQVALACGMYSQDWNDYLVPNAPANDYRGWCNGMENWTTAAANININYYTTNCLAPYVGGGKSGFTSVRATPFPRIMATESGAFQ